MGERQEAIAATLAAFSASIPWEQIDKKYQRDWCRRSSKIIAADPATPVMKMMADALRDIAGMVRIGGNDGIDHEHIARELWRRMDLAKRTLAAYDALEGGDQT